jgi:hypothetical protein
MLVPHYPARFDVDGAEEQRDAQEIPVLVYVVECRDPLQVTAVPSLIWFDTPQKVGPPWVYVAYYSLRNSTVEVFTPLPNGEVNVAQAVFGEVRSQGERGRDVIQRGPQVVDRIPRRTYDAVRDGLDERVRFLRAGRIFLFANGVRVGPPKLVSKGQVLSDVLLGPI